MSFKPSTRFSPITANVSPRDYQALGTAKRGEPSLVVSRSMLRAFAKCPRKWLLGSERKATDAMDWGTLVDCLTLAPKAFGERFVLRPDEYQTTGMKCPVCGGVTDSAKCSKCKVAREEVKVTKPWSEQSATCQAWLEAHKDRVIADPEKVFKARNAVNRMLTDETVGPFLAGCITEQQVCVDYTDPATGITVTLKALPDLVPVTGGTFANCLADLKTTTDADDDAWQRKVFSEGYYYQAALYLDAFNGATGEQRVEFRHVISESSEPYEPAFHFLSEEFLQMGRAEYIRDLQTYCQCLATGHWPGYSGKQTARMVCNGCRITEPTPYMLARAMELVPRLVIPPEPEREPTTDDDLIP